MLLRAPAVWLVLCLASIVVATALQPWLSPLAQYLAAQGEIRRFRHDQHVPRTWTDETKPEVWRDCRGCHHFDANSQFSAPQGKCVECHLPGTLTPKFDADWQLDLSGNSTRTSAAFRHYTHDVLECRECHGADRLYGHFGIETGPGQCARCHEQGRLGPPEKAKLRFFDGDKTGNAAAARQMDAGAYAKKLVEVFAGPGGGLNTKPLLPGGDFDHGDHCGVKDGKLQRLLDCKECHTNILRATATEVGTGQIPPDKCASCHVTGAAKVAARMAAGQNPKPRPLWALGTFEHREHFAFQNAARKPGVCSDTAYTKIAEGCEVCHSYKPEADGSPPRDFPFADGKSLHRYRDCIACHDLPAWKTGESETAALHSSAGRGGDGWQRCTSCHVFGKGDMKRDRRMTDVDRVTERTFVFPANVHLDITTKGIALNPTGRSILDCTSCHRAKVPELATRLAQKLFRHETHLGPTPEPKDCLVCHPTADAATSSSALGGTDNKTYSLAGCSTCHWGGAVTESVQPGEALAAKVERVEFPHGPHVTKGKQACAECHELAANRRDFVTKAKAADCTQCHDHKRGGVEDRGLALGGAASCVLCHHDKAVAPGAPLVLAVPSIRGTPEAPADPRYVVVQEQFAGFMGNQFHPLGMACTACHKAGVQKVDDPELARRLGTDLILTPISRRGVDHVLSTRTRKVHEDGVKQTPQCLQCHWRPVGTTWQAVVGGTPDSPDKKLRLDPAGDAARKKFGNDRDGYPGTQAKG